MIAALSGVTVLARNDGLVHLRCGPVVLELSLPVSQARELRAGDDAELYTYLHFSSSADQLKLFGFTSGAARDLFAVLISASGVGPRVALALLELGVAGLVSAVRGEDEKALVSVPGVGPKLAKKVILELKDKVAKEFAWVAQDRLVGEAASAEGAAVIDALDAVIALGYPRARAEQALALVRRDAPDGLDSADAAGWIRLILQRLASG